MAAEETVAWLHQELILHWDFKWKAKEPWIAMEKVWLMNN